MTNRQYINTYLGPDEALTNMNLDVTEMNHESNPLYIVTSKYSFGVYCTFVNWLEVMSGHIRLLTMISDTKWLKAISIIVFSNKKVFDFERISIHIF